MTVHIAPEAYTRMMDERDAARAENVTLRDALSDVVSDVLAYEKTNNIAPNPGRKYCWDSVARAVAILEKE